MDAGIWSPSCNVIVSSHLGILRLVSNETYTALHGAKLDIDKIKFDGC